MFFCTQPMITAKLDVWRRLVYDVWNPTYSSSSCWF